MSFEQGSARPPRGRFDDAVAWVQDHPVVSAIVLVCVSSIISFAGYRALSREPETATPALTQNENAASEGTPPAPATAPPPQPGEPLPLPPTPTAPAVDAGPPLSATVKVVFKTYPSRRASVMWGGTRLGFIDRNRPLVVERPRDSGPMDVIVRSQGYLPVHVRAYTFDDELVEVKLTPEDKKDTVYGYRQPLPDDAGAPPAPTL